MSWQVRASRCISLLDASNSDEEARTIALLNKVLDEGNHDDYISKDFYNVQQAAGGLPDGMTFDEFVSQISGHVRQFLQSSSFGPDVSDEGVKSAALSFDDEIVKHFRFLNGTVHQIAPGDVHVKLWNLILDSLTDSSSIYSCYTDLIVDDR